MFGGRFIFLLGISSLVLTLGVVTPADNAIEKAMQEVCDSGKTGFKDAEQAVVCYAGVFLVKMISELNSGQAKSAQHVRVHLLPFLGGDKTLVALGSETAEQAECVVCFTAPAVAEQLKQLRQNIPAESVSAYEDLGVCYSTLTDRILNELPKDKEGVMLVSHHMFQDNPVRQVVGMFRALFVNHAYNTRSCRKAHSARPFHKILRKFGKGPAGGGEDDEDEVETAAKAGITQVDAAMKKMGQMKLSEGVSQMFSGVKQMVGGGNGGGADSAADEPIVEEEAGGGEDSAEETEAGGSGDKETTELQKADQDFDPVVPDAAAEAGKEPAETEEGNHAEGGETAEEAEGGMLNKVKSAVGLGDKTEAEKKKPSTMSGVLGNIQSAVGLSKPEPKKPKGVVDQIKGAVGLGSEEKEEKSGVVGDVVGKIKDAVGMGEEESEESSTVGDIVDNIKENVDNIKEAVVGGEDESNSK